MRLPGVTRRFPGQVKTKHSKAPGNLKEVSKTSLVVLEPRFFGWVWGSPTCLGLVLKLFLGRGILPDHFWLVLQLSQTHLQAGFGALLVLVVSKPFLGWLWGNWIWDRNCTRFGSSKVLTERFDRKFLPEFLPEMLV